VRLGVTETLVRGEETKRHIRRVWEDGGSNEWADGNNNLGLSRFMPERHKPFVCV